eukprot:5135831-Prymnesium_polylepis.1
MDPSAPILTLRSSSVPSLQGWRNSSSSASASFGLLGTHARGTGAASASTAPPCGPKHLEPSS